MVLIVKEPVAGRLTVYYKTKFVSSLSPAVHEIEAR